MAKLRKIIEKSNNAIHFHHTTATHITTIPPYFAFSIMASFVRNFCSFISISHKNKTNSVRTQKNHTHNKKNSSITFL